MCLLISLVLLYCKSFEYSAFLFKVEVGHMSGYRFVGTTKISVTKVVLDAYKMILIIISRNVCN